MPRTCEVTISGRDAGGFVWQNVFHVNTDDTTSDLPTLLGALTEYIAGIIPTPLSEAMNSAALILDVAAREIQPSTSYTYHLPQNILGTRGDPASVGAVCGRINFLPATGTKQGRMFVPCGCDGDFVMDVITDDYLDLLNAVGDAYNGINGSEAPYGWQLVVYAKEAETTVDVTAHSIAAYPTTLNKRIRA
jgi:hypothetical protein